MVHKLHWSFPSSTIEAYDLMIHFFLVYAKSSDIMLCNAMSSNLMKCEESVLQHNVL